MNLCISTTIHTYDTLTVLLSLETRTLLQCRYRRDRSGAKMDVTCKYYVVSESLRNIL